MYGFFLEKPVRERQLYIRFYVFSIGIEAESRVNISKDKMLIFKKPQNPMGLHAHLSRPCFQFLKDNVSLADLSSENIFSDVIELCLAGKKCQQLELRKSLRQPKWRNVALFTEFAVNLSVPVK